MTTIRCEICYKPVTQKVDRKDARVRLKGGWAHTKCVYPSKEEELLRSIMGIPPGMYERRRVAAVEAGKKVGHSTKLKRDSSGFYWECTCGLRGRAEPDHIGSIKSATNEAGRQHLRDAFAQEGGD